MRKSVNSASVIKPRGAYSQVLKVGDFVYVSGQMGIDFESGMQDSLTGQVETIFKNTKELLSELNMHINQIVTSTVYVTKDVDLAEVDELYEKHFKQPYPARTVAVVNSLRDPKALVEMSFHAIDLTAYEIMNNCSEDGCDDCDECDCEHHS